MKLGWMNFVGAFALLSVAGCDFDTPEPMAPAPAPIPAAAGTGGHVNPQHGFAAPGQTNFVPGTSTAPAGDATGSTGAGTPGTGSPGAKVDPACAALPPGDACMECLKGDCCSVILKCNADKACSCLLKCVTTQPDNLLGCGISSGCGIPDTSFLTELTTCSKGCVEAQTCKLPAGLPGMGGGQSGLPGLGGLPGGLGGLPGLGGLEGLLNGLGGAKNKAG